MLGRMQRHGDPGRAREIPRPHPGRQHDRAGTDLARVGTHAHSTTVLDHDYLLDLHPLDHACPAHPRPAGKGQRRIDRVGLPVLRQEDAADEIARLHERVPGPDLRRPDHLDLEPEAPPHRGAALQLQEALDVRRHRERPVLPEPGRLPRLRLQRREQLGGVLRQLRHPPRRPQLAHEPGRVPRRPAGELPPLQEQDVGDAEPGQVVRDRAADDTAADDDDVGASGEGGGHGSVQAEKGPVPRGKRVDERDPAQPSAILLVLGDEIGDAGTVGRGPEEGVEEAELVLDDRVYGGEQICGLIGSTGCYRPPAINEVTGGFGRE